MAKIEFAPSGDPLIERAEATARNRDADWLAGCRIHDGLLLQIRHLATLRFDVTVADIASRQGSFASDHANLGHIW